MTATDKRDKRTNLDKDQTDHALIFRVLRRRKSWMHSGDISDLIFQLHSRDVSHEQITRRISDLRNGRYGNPVAIEKKVENQTTYYRIKR